MESLIKELTESTIKKLRKTTGTREIAVRSCRKDQSTLVTNGVSQKANDCQRLVSLLAVFFFHYANAVRSFSTSFQIFI